CVVGAPGGVNTVSRYQAGSTSARPQRPSPLVVEVCTALPIRSPLSGATRNYLDRRAGNGTVGLHPTGGPAEEAGERDLGPRYYRDALRLVARDEFIDLAKGARMIGGLAMIDGAKHE